jgi:peptidoglycan/LPS O-acetylase OafA/YrhL
MAIRYEKSLDGYRAIAVGLVILFHWITQQSNLSWLPLGVIGVTMFFVLSGFLITGILVKAKDEGGTPLRIFKNFYIRRSLRIFPIYYVFVILVFSIYGVDYPHQPMYVLTYTTNIYFFKSGVWDRFSHLWSLAVEEQFYLIWPFVLLFSKRSTKFLLIGFIIVGVLSRIILYLISPGYEFNTVLTPTCFDAFAIGGLLSIYTLAPESKEKLTFFKILNFAAVFSVIVFVFNLILELPFEQISQRFSLSIMFAWIINLLYNKEMSLLKKIFSFPPLVYLGKISYGLYLYHQGFTIAFYFWVQKLMAKYHLYYPFTEQTIFPYVGGIWQNIFYLIFLICIASFSWYCLENPLNKLKKHFV